MKELRLRRGKLFAPIISVFGLVIGGSAFAHDRGGPRMIFDDEWHAETNTLHACVDKHGNMRLVHKANECKKHERHASWNIVGPAGADGAIGPIGAAGPMGPMGAQGPNGEMGPMGAMGLMGPTGPIGLTGATGPQGPIGATGANGEMGPMGPMGPIGLTGAQGSQGLQGLQGLQGIPGANGLDGAMGPIGPAGAQGIAGLQGPAGPMGPPGPPGDSTEAAPAPPFEPTMFTATTRVSAWASFNGVKSGQIKGGETANPHRDTFRLSGFGHSVIRKSDGTVTWNLGVAFDFQKGSVQLINSGLTNEVLKDVTIQMCRQSTTGTVGGAGQTICDASIKLTNARILRMGNTGPRTGSSATADPSGTQVLTFSFEKIDYVSANASASVDVMGPGSAVQTPNEVTYDWNHSTSADSNPNALAFNPPNALPNDVGPASITSILDSRTLNHIMAVARGGAVYKSTILRLWTPRLTGTTGQGTVQDSFHYTFKNSLVDSVVLTPNVVGGSQWEETFTFRATQTEWSQVEGGVTTTFP